MKLVPLSAHKSHERKKSVTRLVCLEGPIGVGKSTLASKLKNECNSGVSVLLEPVEEWTNTIVQPEENKNLLHAMYDGTISSAVFQMAILQSRFSLLVKTLCNPNIHTVISERGPWSEKFVFAKSNLSPCDFAAYVYTQNAMMNTLFDLVGPIEVSFVYLQLDTSRVLDRIKARGRPEEAGITPEYLEKLSKAHKDMEREILKDGTNLKHIVGQATHIHINADVDEQSLCDTVLKAIHLANETHQE